MAKASGGVSARQQGFANTDFTFYTKKEYFQDLRARIDALASGDSAAVMTMAIEATDPDVAAVLHAMNRAAKRGADIVLVVDAHDFIVGPYVTPGPLFFVRHIPSRGLPPYFRHNLQALRALESHGGHAGIVNTPARPLTPSFVGRSHIKLAVINDRVYISSGNLEAMNKQDLMVGWNDRSNAGQLWDLAKQSIETGNVGTALRDTDRELVVDSASSLLIDSGKPKQSLILAKALQLIDEADESVFMTCQFFPNSTTLAHLLKAFYRGVRIRLIYNSPLKQITQEHNLFSGLLHYGVLTSERLRVPDVLTSGMLPSGKPYMHVKLLASEKCVIIGSHNYIQAGVDFGTAEIALIRHDGDFARTAISAVQDQICQ